MLIDERIPTLTDIELGMLHSNAVRLSQSGTQQQKEKADMLLPQIDAALDLRRAAKEVELKEKRQTSAKKKTVSARAARKSEDQNVQEEAE